jgi:hypothetical protein
MLDGNTHACMHACLTWTQPVHAQAAVLLQGLLVRRPDQRLTASKALHIVETLADEQ